MEEFYKTRVLEDIVLLWYVYENLMNHFIPPEAIWFTSDKCVFRDKATLKAKIIFKSLLKNEKYKSLEFQLCF